MGSPDDSRAAVRIELSADGGVATPRPAQPAPPGGGKNTIVALVAAALLVAGLLYVTRPADGENAAGAPITAPPESSVAPATNASDTESSGEAESSGGDADTSTNDAVSEEENVSETRTDSAQFDAVDFDTFMFSVVRADVGWFGLGFSGNTAGLWRSVNGLNWTAMSEDTLPDGDLVGFDRIDGVYVVAIDEEESWSENGFTLDEGEFPRHRINVWQSSDAVNWFPTERPALDGVGFPYPASFSSDAYIVPMVEPSNSDETVIRFLEPFVDAATAMRVCSTRRDFSEPTMIVFLESCDGDVIAEISESDFPEDFRRLTREYCLEQALSIDAQRTVSVVVHTDKPVRKVELDDSFALFGRALADGFVAQSGLSITGSIAEECGGEANPGPRTDGVVYWTEDAGQVDVSPPNQNADTTSDPWLAFPQGRLSLIPDSDDGRLRVTNEEGIWEGVPPFETWEFIAAPPELEATLLGERPATVSLSRDGGAAIVQTREKLYLWAGDEWTSVDFTELDGVELLVSNDEMVIISGQSSRGQRLMRIWFRS